MKLEDVLRSSANTVAERVVPRAPDVEALRQRGRRAKRRRVTIAAAALSAAVTVGVLVAAPQWTRTDPQPVDESPQELNGAVWWDADGAHVGDLLLTVPEAAEGVPPTFGLLRSGLVYSFHDDLYFHPVTGERRAIAPRPVWGPIGDLDGTLAAWLEAGPDGEELVVHDTSTDDVVWRVGIDVDNRSDSDQPVLLLTAERVVYESSGRLWQKWLLDGGPPERIGTRAEALVDLAENVAVLGGEQIVDKKTGAPSLTTMRFVTGDAPSGSPTYGPVFHEGLLSDDGRWFVTTKGYQDELELIVVDTATGRPVKFRRDIRGAPMYRPYGWAYGDTLMVLVHEGRRRDPERPRLVACQVIERACTRVTGDPIFALPNNPFAWQ